MNESSFRTFAYRYPRLSTDLAIDFILDEKIMLGCCESLSEGGISARFMDDLPVGVTGTLTLYYEDVSISTRAIILGSEEGRAAMQFVLSGADEHSSLRAFIEALRPNSTS